MMVSFLQVKEAPLDWLIDNHRAFMHSTLLVQAFFFGALGVLMGCSAVLYSTFAETSLAIGAAAVSAIAAGAAHHLRMPNLKSEPLESVMLAAMCGMQCITCLTPLFVSDTGIRNRTFVFLLMLWKPFPALLGFRMSTCMYFHVWGWLNECCYVYLTGTYHNEDIPLRINLILGFIHVLHLNVARYQHASLRTLYDVQEELAAEKKELAAEKEASEMLLSTVCDASFWLAGDGATLVQTDSRLDGLIGCSMQGERFSDHCFDSEWERVHACIQGNTEGHSSRVRVLPTSLSRQYSKTRLDVDLFVVDRIKDVRPENILARRYLVGLRLNSDAPLEAEFGRPTQMNFAIHAPCHVPNRTRSNTGSSTANTCLDNLDSMSQASSASASAVRIPRRHGQITGQHTAKASPSSLFGPRREGSEIAGSDHNTNGPRAGPPFRESDEYLINVLQGLLDDIAGCMNFRVTSCCAWHQALEYLAEALKGLRRLHSCSEGWCPAVAWQCENCTALIRDDMPDDFCWLCQEAHMDPTGPGEHLT
eukprot:gnl/TRDRNA2_/TRDRNA2_176432_c0_seq14.p1 gnl/TRDRNA2_/TRDRNA2_176432_c0~~gnl/TRDRNA2_/TRDRNA2_176432_c0_seq14.p1  ORF type:complete len:534 (-),score=50.25 gnl/TRDRNA2_/TRDRNA2_176432_c0_seq14:105-1706(-)